MSEDSDWTVVRIVSGGQTGADRGALDAAIDLGIEHAGWCPLGRVAEDGTIPARYALTETETADYPSRTQRNVVDSDGTLILYRDQLAGGTKLTRRLAKRHGKPSHLQNLAESLDVEAARQWIGQHRIRVLNVAGPRESSAPGIQLEAYRFVLSLLGQPGR